MASDARLGSDLGQALANIVGQRRSRPVEQPAAEASGGTARFFLLHPGGEPAGDVWIAAGEIGEEGDECFVVGAFVDDSESRAVKPLPTRILHIIDHENAVQRKLRRVV
jgi:hypothetical protein